MASFGDYRYYTFEDKDVSESWHMGIDLASTQKADIVANNDGTVEFAADNGIYGRNILINHGFGLFSLYEHCNSLNVKVCFLFQMQIIPGRYLYYEIGRASCRERV